MNTSFSGELRSLSDSHHSITIHTHQLFSVVHFTCALAPTVIMKVIDFGSSCLAKETSSDRRETGQFYTIFPTW